MEEIRALRPRSRPVRRFVFGLQTITTKVWALVPEQAPIDAVHVTAAIDAATVGRGDASDDALLSAMFVGEDA
jgi:hypothetical protein